MLILEIFGVAFAAGCVGILAWLCIYIMLVGKNSALKLVETTFKMKEGRLTARHFDKDRASEVAQKAGEHVGILYFCGTVVFMLVSLVLKSFSKTA